MRYTLSFFIVIYLIVIYWAQYLVENPLKRDLSVICEKRDKISGIDQSKLHKETQKVLPYLLKVNSEEREMILSDFAKSKKLTWSCPQLPSLD
ncbi:MAG: hypothetical protein ACJAS4_000448 [Bacteriovoracaceae bacterium]|jgi:hypothetical protein